jgi:hypothetical protein
MSTTNPSIFVSQFRDELIADLALSPTIACPKCCITYVGEYDGCCRYERRCDSEESDSDSDSGSDSDSDSSDEPITAEILAQKYELVCVFDYERTPMSTVLNEWAEQLLKACYTVGGSDLKEKWANKIAGARVAFGN